MCLNSRYTKNKEILHIGLFQYLFRVNVQLLPIRDTYISNNGPTPTTVLLTTQLILSCTARSCIQVTEETRNQVTEKEHFLFTF
jgi:hypothetical protein